MRTLIERFEGKVELIPFSTCHWWVACTSEDGYGQFNIKYKMQYAHRVAYELYVGPIPENDCILHKCDNPPCVNPAHLFPGTHADNVRDRDEKGRQDKPKGNKNGRSKLTDDDVIKIRAMEGTMTQIEIGKLFGILPPQISKILRRQTWSHI